MQLGACGTSVLHAKKKNLLLYTDLLDSVLDCPAVPTLQSCHDFKIAPVCCMCKCLRQDTALPVGKEFCSHCDKM